MYPYQNPNLPAKERAADLLSRMDFDEKLGQVQCAMPAFWPAGKAAQEFPHGVGQVAGLAITTLSNGGKGVGDTVRKLQDEIMAASKHHIPAIFHIETLGGVLMPGATSFPSGIGQGATWDPALQHEAGALIREQAKSVGFRQAFAPVLDVTVDPRFGRIGESHGEDPTLCAAMGTAYTLGIQGDGDLQNSCAATSKHFLGYHAGVAGQHAAAIDVPPRKLRETFGKPFQAAMTVGGLRSVMNAYGSIDGVPMTASKEIFTDLLRGEMGFEGVTVSDYTAVEELGDAKMKIAATPAEAGLRALKAGMDVDLPNKGAYDAMGERFRQGKGDMAALDRAVLNHLTLKFELGLFENPYAIEEAYEAAYDAEKSYAVTLQQARESLVLLKNDGVLPLDLKGKKIALIGWHGVNSFAYFGGYTMVSMAENALGMRSMMDGVDEMKTDEDKSLSKELPGTSIVRSHPGLEQHVKKYVPHTRNLFEELQHLGTDVRYAKGYDVAGTDCADHAEALALCAESDVVILTLGGKYGWTASCTTGEGVDSVYIGLPPCQEQFLEKFAKLGKPGIGLHFDGRPISSDAADACLSAIVECWSPAEAGGQAIGEVLTGAYNPGGKLPVTVLYEAGQAPMTYRHPNGSSYHVMDENEFGETNRHYTTRPFTPRYFFGHGLSYTTFEYSDFALNCSEVAPDGTVTATVTVTNTGVMAGDEVVQLYARDVLGSLVRPALELVGFKRIHLQPGESKTLCFTLQCSQLAFIDEDYRWKIEAGEIQLKVGGGVRDLRAEAAFTITDDAWIEGKNRAFWADVTIA